MSRECSLFGVPVGLGGQGERDGLGTFWRESGAGYVTVRHFGAKSAALYKTLRNLRVVGRKIYSPFLFRAIIPSLAFIREIQVDNLEGSLRFKDLS